LVKKDASVGQQESAMSASSDFDPASNLLFRTRYSAPKSQDDQADNTQGKPTVGSAIDYGKSGSLEKVVWLFEQKDRS
jgi:hypothetical protein